MITNIIKYLKVNIIIIAFILDLSYCSYLITTEQDYLAKCPDGISYTILSPGKTTIYKLSSVPANTYSIYTQTIRAYYDCAFTTGNNKYGYSVEQGDGNTVSFIGGLGYETTNVGCSKKSFMVNNIGSITSAPYYMKATCASTNWCDCKMARVTTIYSFKLSIEGSCKSCPDDYKYTLNTMIYCTSRCSYFEGMVTGGVVFSYVVSSGVLIVEDSQSVINSSPSPSPSKTTVHVTVTNAKYTTNSGTSLYTSYLEKSNNSNSSDFEQQKSKTIGAIVGSVVGFILILALIGYCIIVKRKMKL